MNGAFYIGATGLRAQQASADVTAHNLANMNTVAFKRATLSFAELIAAPSPELAATRPAEHGLSGVALVDPVQDFAPGNLRQTGNELDLAIRGKGFIELLGPAGQTLLWRGGTLRVNDDGFLAAENGMQLKTMISVPRDTASLRIADTGEVLAYVGTDTTEQTLGRLELVQPRDTRKLHNLGGAIYRLDDTYAGLGTAEAGEEGLGYFAQGFSEASNVELTEEIVSMMVMQRAYAANAKLIQAGDELMGIVNGLKR